MSSFTLTFSTDGAAFADHPGTEIARLLRQTAADVDVALHDDSVVRVRDVNGNRVGFFMHAVDAVLSQTRALESVMGDAQ